MWVYAGSYTSDILRLRRDPQTGQLTDPTAIAKLPNPTWLAWHPRGDVLYAASETDDGAVAAVKLDGFTTLGQQPTHGGDPCHLAVDPSGGFVVVANYGGGNVAVLPLGPDGDVQPASDVVTFPARAHAHQVVFHGGGVVVTDLGNDEINEYTLDAGSGRLLPRRVAKTPAGCGPRHVLFSSSGYLFVAAELDSSVLVLDGEMRLLSARPATLAPPAARNYPSGLVLSPDERFLYVANRGADCVTVFAVDGPHLEPVADVPCAGVWPRDITFIAGTLYVANQRSSGIAGFAIDPATGLPAHTGTVSTAKPARVLGPAGDNGV